MSLYLKHRPNNLDDFYGNNEVALSLSTMMDNNNIPHASMFTGPSGCGKTTLARILAKELDCKDIDLQEIDIADFRGIDTVRELRSSMHFAPVSSKNKVYIIDEAHQLTKDAQNCLLKALEDTPKHVYFMLCTTNPEKLLKTVKTRCTAFNVVPLSDRVMEKLLNNIISSENKEVPDEVVKQIVTDSQGSSRLALVVLDKIIDLDQKTMLKAAKRQAEKESKSIELCRALIKKAPWKEISKIVKTITDEPETVRRAVLGYCGAVLLNSGKSSAYIIMNSFRYNFFDTGKQGLIMACFEAVNEL